MNNIFFQDAFKENSRLMQLSDADLLTEDGFSFPIHKYVLARSSSYFRDLFCGMEKDKKEYLIPGVRGEILCNILSYIYTDKIQVTEENIVDVFLASDYLLIENLFCKMKASLITNLTVGNCLAMHMCLLKMNDTNLILRKSYRFIETHFEEILCCGNEDFYDLPLEFLKRLLSEKNLRVQNEKVVWHAIVKWVEADLSSRLCRVLDLLMYVRTTDVDENLAAEIMTHEMVAKNKFSEEENYKSMLKIYQRYFWNDFTQLLPFCSPRKPVNLNFIGNFSGKFNAERTQIYVTFDEDTDLWRKVIEVNFYPDYLVCVDNCIYVFDATENIKCCYDVVEKRWKNIRNFGNPRINYAVVELNGLIYVLGGMSSITLKDAGYVEIYNPATDIWYSTTTMTPVNFVSAVTLDGSIYVAGGAREDDVTILQRYDPSPEIWNLLHRISVLCLRTKLVTYKDKLYIIEVLYSNLTRIEVYDPLKNVWYSIQSLPCSCDPRPLVINDRLIVTERPDPYEVFSKDNTRPAMQWNSDLDIWEIAEEISALRKLHHYFFSVQKASYISVISNENKLPSTVFEKSPFA